MSPQDGSCQNYETVEVMQKNLWSFFPDTLYEANHRRVFT